MKTRIQTLMDEYEQAKTTYNKAVEGCELATRYRDEQVAELVEQILEIEGEHEKGILTALDTMNAAELALKKDAEAAWISGDVFPAGKKRLPLDRRAWVQVTERKKREVIDASAAARFIVEEGIEDTAIKNLTLVNDVVDAVVTIKKAFPGVDIYTTGSVSISLPKTKAPKKEENSAT